MAGEAPQARREIRELLAAAGHEPDRRRGQNFLAEPSLVHRIVELADCDGASQVVEIGAGTGTLTGALAACAKRVVAYEVDEGLAPALTAAVGDLDNIDLRFADATRIDLADELDGGPWTMVANLPYNVGTGIVLDALQNARSIGRFVVMVQLEVAERMLAEPGSRTYGLPSVIVGLHATGRIALRVPPSVFEPQPPVSSAVVALDRVPAPSLAGEATAIAATAFGQRRKMLRRSLASVFADPIAVLEAAGIDPTARPEELDPARYVAIAAAAGA